MASDIFAETVALSAIFQSAVQIQRIARFGTVDESAIAPLMRALIITNPTKLEDIYTTDRLLVGLKQLISCLNPSEATNAQNTEILKIAYSIMSLEINLEKQKAIYAQLDKEVDLMRDRVLDVHADYETADDRVLIDYTVVKLYSKIYSSLLSPNFPKLIIYGENAYLTRPEFQELIRALLLSGVRAAVLWRQVGGKRYTMMFKYKDVIECARNILEAEKV